MHFLRLNTHHSVVLYAVRGYEALSRLFYFDLDIDALGAELSGSQWLQQCFSFQIKQQVFHGEVVSFTNIAPAVYRLRLMPSISCLQHEQHSRVYRNQSALDIIKSLLKGYPVEYGALAKDYLLRAHCVQYEESNWAFIERLLAEEGIRYYFVFTREQHRLILDDQIASKLYESALHHRYEREEGYLMEWQEYYYHGINQLSSSDYNYQSPQQSLCLNHCFTASSKLKLERQIYPGPYGNYAQAMNLLESRAQACKQVQHFVLAQSYYEDLRPNYLVYLAAQNNALYLIEAIWHEAEDLSYRSVNIIKVPCYHNKLRAIPGCSFKANIPRKMLIPNAQLARVAGEGLSRPAATSGAELALIFEWDEAGLPLLARIAQCWAGSQLGMQFFPRTGDRVLVYFMNGDPERPIIWGAVNEADQPPLYDIHTSGMRTQNQTAFNELRFSNNSDQEGMYWHAAGDYSLKIGRDLLCEAQNFEIKIAEGNLNFTSGESYEIYAEGHIEFRVGNSLLKLTPEKIILRSTSIHLN